MATYVRPEIDPPVLRDAAGAVIDYGNRWPDGPPEDSYSVDHHPERFAPLHTVAEALIDHLVHTFDVTVTEGPAVLSGFRHPAGPDDDGRAVRITPRSERSAAVTFHLTAYPGVAVHAGILQDFVFPVCGCDACDDTWDTQADSLEETVLAVVAGGFRESVGRQGWRWTVGHELRPPDGGFISSTEHGPDIPREELRSARERLRAVPHGWAPWPLRPLP